MDDVNIDYPVSNSLYVPLLDEEFDELTVTRNDPAAWLYVVKAGISPAIYE